MTSAWSGGWSPRNSPAWRGLSVRAVRSTGTVNAIFRLGDHLYARLPRLARYAQALDRECRWLPELTPRLPLRIPEPVAQGEPADRHPFTWAIYRWIDGQPYADELVDDERQAAGDLAGFVAGLRRMDPGGAPRTGRRPLRELDEGTRAVIDFGGVGAGDPAADVIAAWSVFGVAGRRAFRAALSVDDDTWNRARGYALHQAALIIPYYAETNPGFVAMAKRTVEEVLADVSGAR